jgi:sulfate-transporting ATPase
MLSALIYLLLTLPLIGAYAILALGIVVIFRASRVLNLAHGAMAMAPTYLVYTLTEHHIPVLIALPIGVGFGGLLGVLTERLFVRPLRRQGPTAQTVGTVAVFGVLVSVVAKIYGTSSLHGARVFPDGGIDLKGSILLWGNVGLFATSVVVAGAFVALFRYTNLGLALRGAADNRTAAALVGVNPDRAAVSAWLIGGGLAALAGILLGGTNAWSPYSLSLQMLPAFVAALIGGLGSIGGALIGALLVGSLTGIVPVIGLISALKGLAGQLGASQLLLTGVALFVMYFRGSRYSSSDIREEAAGGTDTAGGQRRYDQDGTTEGVSRSHRLRNYAVLVVLVSWPFLGAPFSLLGDAIRASQYVIAASSIVLLTGWVGQISLAQATFVGIGGYGCAIVIGHTGLTFPLNLVIGALIAAAAAACLGVVALRVRGLYLAVATLIFAYMGDQYLFAAPWFAGPGGITTIELKPVGSAHTFPYFDLSDKRVFYFITLSVAGTVLFALANLRDSKTGRAFFAIRGSETAAASLGIDVQRYKLIGFALAGGIAGLAGNLALMNSGTISGNQFNIGASLFILAIAVVGGLQSLGGVVAASILFAILYEVFYRVSFLSGFLEVVSAGLLAFVLLLYPGGLARIPTDVRGLWLRVRPRLLPTDATWVSRLATKLKGRPDARPHESVSGEIRPRTRLSQPVLAPLVLPDTVVSTIAPSEPELPALPDIAADGEPSAGLVATDLASLGEGAGVPASLLSPGTPILEARHVRVEFDGLVAVAEASLTLNQGQIVGLIGPNGAGKTTLFNAISGLVVPTRGTVHIYGEDVTSKGVHERARLGLGRTFQAIQLFPQLSVYENLLVATHSNNSSGLFSHVALTRDGLRHEAASEKVVRTVVAAMGLSKVADRAVGGLPFGVLRHVEIARTVVTGSPVIMLDEPASGLDNAETDRLSELLLDLRDRLGLTLLLIEHDVRMVTEVSDYMYVLVYGQIVSQGSPDHVRRDPVVTAAYLGEPTNTSDAALELAL